MVVSEAVAVAVEDHAIGTVAESVQRGRAEHAVGGKGVAPLGEIQVAGENRSAYINELLKQESKNHLKQALLKANLEEAADSEYQEELKEWNTVLSDGLSND